MPSSSFRCDTHVLPCSHIRGYARSTSDGQEDVLRLHVKQYTPLNNIEPQPGGVTIIAAHATGFPKELYEPLWDELLAISKRPTSEFWIRSIWIADVANHGESSALNSGKLGNEGQREDTDRETRQYVVSWDDHARDLLHLINTFRDRMPRPLVGIGHSMGGNHIISLALLHPRLFTTIITIEPILLEKLESTRFAMAYWISQRRERWPSREAAIAEARKSPVFKGWDERVFSIWTRTGYREAGDSGTDESAVGSTSLSQAAVKLSTPKHAELATVARACHPQGGSNNASLTMSDFVPTWITHPELMSFSLPFPLPVYRGEAYTTFQKLPFLRPSCLYVSGSMSLYWTASKEGNSKKLQVTGTGAGGSGGVSEGRVESQMVNGGHFSPFENPPSVAFVAAEWLDKELVRWKAEEEREKREWGLVDPQKKAEVSPETIDWIKRHWANSKI